jgi:hypothetical protein
MLESVGHVDFEPLLGKIFGVTDLPVELTLAEVALVGGPADHSGGARQPFSLLFHGPGEPVLPQRLYGLSCGDSSWELFLVPVGPGPDGVMRYESCFN